MEIGKIDAALKALSAAKEKEVRTESSKDEGSQEGRSTKAAFRKFRAEGLKLLPPEIQEEIEKQAILANPKLVELLGNAIIESIEKNEDGYLVITSDYQMQIDVKYLPQPMPGPAQFELNFHQPKPRA